MINLKHPFIMGLKFALQNMKMLFLGINFCPGGNLSELVSKKKRL